VSHFLIIRKHTVSNLKHVRIVPSSTSGHVCTHSVFQEVGLELLPLVSSSFIHLDVVGSSPGVGDGAAPRSNLFVTPVADGVENISSSAGKSSGHVSVSGLCRDSLVVTIIVLKVIDTPVCILLGVCHLVAQ